MTKKARRAMSRFAADSAFAGADTALTLWFRLPLFGFTSLMPMAKRQAEAARMIDEKAAALVEGAMLANMEVIRLAGGLLSGRISPHELSTAPLSIAAAGLRPAFRQVRANARRLGRDSLRPFE